MSRADSGAIEETRAADTASDLGSADGELEPLAGEAEVSISNEFARVVVRKVYTHNGERLEIHAPFFQAVVRLDPLQLETLARKDHALFARLSAASSAPNGEALPEGAGEDRRRDE